MIPTQYYPFASPRFALELGVVPLPPGKGILEREALTPSHLQVKAALLAERPYYYLQTLPEASSACSEMADLLGFPGQSLEAIGGAVSEDLLLLCAEAPQRLLAGHLCFANGWCLEEKIGRPLLAIHETVPGYAETLAEPTAKLLSRLKPGRPVGRLNWGVRPTDRLDLSSRWNDWVQNEAASITQNNAGERCYLRVERQTLTALPESRSVLFTIHTYQQAVATLSLEQQALLLGVLETIPPAMAEYKGLVGFRESLLRWFRFSSK